MKKRNTFLALYILFAGMNVFGLSDLKVNIPEPFRYYVSFLGDDSNSGTSVSSPFKTIAAANAVVQPGDTVFLRAGEYSDPIKPANGGKKGKYITYKAYEDEKPILTATKSPGISIHLPADITYICVDGIYADGKGEHYNAYNSTITHWLIIEGSYNTIQNCNFHSALGWYGLEIRETAAYNKILNNRMDLVGTVNIAITNNNESKADMLMIRGNYNLVEGNHFSRGGHNIIETKDDAKYNVIRNNLIENDWGDGKRYRAFVPAGINLWEDNIIAKCGYVEGQRTTMNVGTFQFYTSYGIIRRNIFMANYAKGMNGGCSDRSRPYRLAVYNNVFYNTASTIIGVGSYSKSCVENPATHIYFKNNIIFNDGNKPIDSKFTGDPFIKFQGMALLAQNRFIANSFFENGKEIIISTPNDYGNKSLLEMQTLAPDNFSDNIIAKPLFIVANPINYEDFQLSAGSHQINKGAFLTFTVEADSSNSLKVEEAMYFCDGFGLIEGDRIQLDGQTIVAKVLNVNYDTNIITLDRELNYVSGQGVSLAYNGASPDIGAHESGFIR